MKLRIKGNSLRFRLTQSEVARLSDSEDIKESIYFGPSSEARLGYTLRVSLSNAPLSVEYSQQTVTVGISEAAVSRWAGNGSDVGIYGSVDIGGGTLDLLIEKDFACLDATEEENRDTFPHPSGCLPA